MTPLLVIALLACTADCPPGSSRFDDGLCTLDEDAPVSDPGWTSGEVKTCAEPRSEVTYTDLGLSDPGWSELSNDSISIAAAQVDGQWQVFTTDHNSAVVRYTLDGQPPQRTTPGGEISRLLISDIDGDGVGDLHTLGWAVMVGWSMGEQWETVLSDEDGYFGSLSSTTLDLNGDGDREILLPAGIGLADTPEPAELLTNTPDGFKLDTVSADVDFWGSTFSTVIFDADDDLDLDVYLCNDFGPETAPNGLLISDGVGGLSPGDARGADVVTYCMSAAVADLNNDGLLDLYIAALSEQFALVDTEDGYVNQAAAWGFSSFSDDHMPWGSAVGDTDNDGLNDIVLATGAFASVRAGPIFPLLRLHQTAPGVWSEDGEAAGLPQLTNTRAVLLVELNGDGVLDILASDITRPPHVLLSEGCTAAGWLEVAVPDGTRVEIEVDGTVRTALASVHPGFSASAPSTAWFGLGEAEQVDRVRAWVPWVGEVVYEGPLPVNQRLTWSSP